MPYRLSILAVALLFSAVFPAKGNAQSGGATLVITVVDSETRAPLVGARVQLVDVDLFALTNPDGRATISGIPPGEHTLDVAQFGYLTERAMLAFFGEELAEGEVAMMREAIAIDGVIARAERTRSRRLERSGFYDRKSKGWGSFLERDEIEEKALFDTASLLRRMPGIRVSFGSRRNRFVVGRRAPVSLQVSQYQMGCTVPVYLDGLPWSGTIDDIPIDWIGGIEAYSGPAGIPIEYVGRSSCGLVLIWTD